MATPSAARFGAGLLALFWCATLLLRPVVSSCPMGSLHATLAHGETTNAVDAQSAAEHGPGELAADAHANGEHTILKLTLDGHTPVGSPGSPHEAQHPCDCLSHCCATALTRTVDPAPLLVATIQHSIAPRMVPEDNVTIVRSPVVLPFATAPPVAALG